MLLKRSVAQGATDGNHHGNGNTAGGRAGERNPSLLVMAKIAEALSISLPKLLGE
jgi:hypothetical protein